MATYYCRYSDILSYGATWSLTSGSANSAFPLTNLNLVDADTPSKTTGTAATYRGTIASTAIQAIALINCNLAGLTLTVTNNNGAPVNTSLVVPAANVDGLSLNAWVDLRAVTNAGTQWNIAITGAAANIAIGKILLISSLRTADVRWRPRMGESTPMITHRTASGKMLSYRRGTRIRTFGVEFTRETERSNYVNLRRSSVGPSQPWVFIPEGAVNDPVYGFFPEPIWELVRESPNVTRWSDTLEEMSPGVAL